MKIFSTLKKQATAFLDQYRQGEPATFAAAEQAIGGILIVDGFIGIDNPFGGKKRPGIFGTIGGLIFGIIFLFIPTIFGGLTGINDMTAKTTATVVSVKTNANTSSTNVRSNTSSSSAPSCSVTARYTVNGKEYTNQASMSSSGYCSLSEGQEIAINYNPANPGSWAYNAKMVSSFLWVFFGVGILMIISSIVTFAIRLLSIIFGWKLLKDGRKLAESLPQGTNLETIINEIKQSFTAHVFNFGGASGVGAAGGIASTLENMAMGQTSTQQPSPAPNATPPAQAGTPPTNVPPTNGVPPVPEQPPTQPPAPDNNIPQGQ